MTIFRPASIPRLWLAAVILAPAMAGCSHNAAERGDDASPKAEVTLTHIVRADISEMLTLTGTAAALPNQDVRVSALVSGRVAELNVAEGDRVEIGQLLAKIDDRPYRDQLQQSEAGEQQARANLANAQTVLGRNEDLFGRGIAARKDLDDARLQQSVAQAALRQAEAALELAHLQLSRTRILSPLNGEVAKRFLNVGEQVDGTAAQPIVEVADLREVEFLCNTPAAYLARIHAGEPVEVTTQAVPEKKFPGRVVAISPAVDPATGLGLVRIRVPNFAGLMRLGIFLTADVSVDTHARALVAPPEAIYRNESGEPRVFVVHQTTATAVPVKIGIENKQEAELIPAAPGSLKDGDTVILTGGYGLGDTAQIQVKGPSPQ